MKNLLFTFLVGLSCITGLSVQAAEEAQPHLYTQGELDTIVDQQTFPCAICLMPITEAYECTPCRHLFHKDCVDQLRQHSNQPTCPICRTNLNIGLNDPRLTHYIIRDTTTTNVRSMIIVYCVGLAAGIAARPYIEEMIKNSPNLPIQAQTTLTNFAEHIRTIPTEALPYGYICYASMNSILKNLKITSSSTVIAKCFGILAINHITQEKVKGHNALLLMITLSTGTIMMVIVHNYQSLFDHSQLRQILHENAYTIVATGSLIAWWAANTPLPYTE
jgi:hypothetical protein